MSYERQSTQKHADGTRIPHPAIFFASVFAIGQVFTRKGKSSPLEGRKERGGKEEEVKWMQRKDKQGKKKRKAIVKRAKK